MLASLQAGDKLLQAVYLSRLISFFRITCIEYEQQKNMVAAINEGLELMLVFFSKFSTENEEGEEDFSEEEGEQRKSTVSLKKVHPC